EGGLDLGRQLEVADANGGADVQAAHVDHDLPGDRMGGAGDFDVVQDHAQGAAALDAGRGVLVGELHGHFDLDLLVLVDPVEVEVPRLVGDRVHVDGLGDHRLGLAVVLQRD